MASFQDPRVENKKPRDTAKDKQKQTPKPVQRIKPVVTRGDKPAAPVAISDWASI